MQPLLLYVVCFPCYAFLGNAVICRNATPMYNEIHLCMLYVNVADNAV
jgi:hypothetical protein